MNNCFYAGWVEMKPKFEESECYDFMEYEGYPYAIPNVYLDGCGEEYYLPDGRGWEDDSIVWVRGGKVVQYTKSKFLETRARGDNDECIWLDARRVSDQSDFAVEYLNEYREANEYRIEEYDLEKSEKKKYKVLLEETSSMDESDRFRLKNFVDAKLFQISEEQKFEIHNGVLVSYKGFDEDLVIPEGIRSISYGAFCSKNKDFRTITIPASLTDIQKSMFNDCRIQEINVAEGNTRYYSKNGLLIDKQNKTLVWAYSGSEIPADGSVISIGKMAFKGRADLESIVIPDTVKEIGEGAFQGCTKLKSVEGLGAITYIGNYVFSNCESLEIFVIPNTVEGIGDYTFSDCLSLQTIVIPNSVKKMGQYVFNECSGLAKVVLSSPITQINAGMFYGCNNLREIVIPNSVIEIGFQAFRGCASLEHVDIPNSVVRISRCAFMDCTSLMGMVVPDSVEYMGDSVFASCKSLQTVKISSIVVLPRDIFRYCSSLKEVDFPKNLLKIDDGAFYGCEALTFVELPKDLIEIGGNAFSGSGLIKLNLPDSVKLLNDNALAGCRELREINMPEVFYADEERIFGGELQRGADGKYCVKNSTLSYFGGFVF